MEEGVVGELQGPGGVPVRAKPVEALQVGSTGADVVDRLVDLVDRLQRDGDGLELVDQLDQALEVRETVVDVLHGLHADELVDAEEDGPVRVGVDAHQLEDLEGEDVEDLVEAVVVDPLVVVHNDDTAPLWYDEGVSVGVLDHQPLVLRKIEVQVDDRVQLDVLVQPPVGVVDEHAGVLDVPEAALVVLVLGQ